MTELPIPVEDMLDAGTDPEYITDHLNEVQDQIEEFTDGTRTGNMVYAQAHVLEKAVELLRDAYEQPEALPERKDELIATAIILEQESDEKVWK